MEQRGRGGGMCDWFSLLLACVAKEAFFSKMLGGGWHEWWFFSRTVRGDFKKCLIFSKRSRGVFQKPLVFLKRSRFG